MNSAAKIRNYRARQRAGLAFFRVTAPQFAVVEFLIATKRLTIADALDRRRVEHALAELVGDLANRWVG